MFELRRWRSVGGEALGVEERPKPVMEDAVDGDAVPVSEMVGEPHGYFLLSDSVGAPSMTRTRETGNPVKLFQ